MSSVADGFGAALENQASEVMTLTEAIGPVTLMSHNLGDNPVVLSVHDKASGALVATDDETAVADEDTAYDGDTSTTDFSGEALNNTPIIPGSVVVKPTSGGDSVNATDRDGDGRLYTSDVDEDFCGTIDYSTGDLVLEYPAGKAPNTGDIDADYSYAGAAQVGRGKRSIRLSNNPPSKDFIVKATGLGGDSRVQVSAFISF